MFIVNHAEVLYRRRELHGLLNAETADDWVAEKGQYYALLRKHYEELDARASDPDVDDRTLARLTREAVAILNKVPELRGWLTLRTAVLVDTVP